eukprot:18382-Heterococcus_DN1.PRE.2
MSDSVSARACLLAYRTYASISASTASERSLHTCAQVYPQLQAMSSAITKWHLQHQEQHSTAVIGSSVLFEMLAQ